MRQFVGKHFRVLTSLRSVPQKRKILLPGHERLGGNRFAEIVGVGISVDLHVLETDPKCLGINLCCQASPLEQKFSLGSLRQILNMSFRQRRRFGPAAVNRAIACVNCRTSLGLFGSKFLEHYYLHNISETIV